MKIACICFTKHGEKIADKIKKELRHNIDLYFREDLRLGLHDTIKNIFDRYQGIIFISSTGIAVRLIAPYIKHKMCDPAIVVIDDLGRYSISLLSGHIGGANELAKEVARSIGAIDIITTASDGRGIDSVDVFAKKNNLIIENVEDAKRITSLMIDEKVIGLISDKNLRINYSNIDTKNAEGYIIVTPEEEVMINKPYCVLRPKVLNVGIGCKRGKKKHEILEAIQIVFKENNLSIKSIKAIGTVELKKDEIGLIKACQELCAEFKVFTAEEIQKVQHKFGTSKFVFSVTGVTAVAEPCAYLLGGNIIVKKKAINGITIAVARED